MLSKKIEKLLNEQIHMEGMASMFYLSMASWAEVNGYNGVAHFLYGQSDEERNHMLKLVRFVNERGGHAQVPALEKPKTSFSSARELFELLLDNEVKVTQSIGELVGICIEEKDFTTHNFLQWYVSEQLEEEAQARAIMDKIKLIGNEQGGWYLLDRDIQNMHTSTVAEGPSGD